MNRLCFAFLGALAGCGAPADQGTELPECDGALLFQDQACMKAVMERCRAIEAPADCAAASPIETGDFSVICGWTLVTPLLEKASCELAPSFGRCEAGLPYFDGAAAFGTCEPDGQIPGGITVFLEEREFVQIDTGASEVIGGVLGPWALIDAAPGEVAVCGGGWTPPGPDWCSCADAVCAGP